MIALQVAVALLLSSFHSHGQFSAALMDRRHWYLVSKLQDSLGLKSAQLEAFLCQDGTFADLQSFADAQTLTLFVWQLPGVVRRDTLMPSDLDSWSPAGSDGASAPISTFACSASPPSKFANKCIYFIWLDQPGFVSAVPSMASVASQLVTPAISSTTALATSLAHAEVFHVDSSHGDLDSSMTEPQFKPDQDFGDAILTGELEPQVGPDMQASFLTTLLPHLAHADWGKASEEDVVAFHAVRPCGA